MTDMQFRALETLDMMLFGAGVWQLWVWRRRREFERNQVAMRRLFFPKFTIPSGATIELGTISYDLAGDDGPTVSIYDGNRWLPLRRQDCAWYEVLPPPFDWQTQSPELAEEPFPEPKHDLVERLL